MTTPDDEGPRTSTLGHTATATRVQPVRLLVVDGPDRGKDRVVTEGTATNRTRCARDAALVDREHALAASFPGLRVDAYDA